MNKKVLYLISYFLIYSFIGYLIETFCVSMMNRKLVLTRGFLIGPCIPIFGVGATLITIALKKYHNFGAIFILSALIGTALEYFSSLFIEKLFKIRLWDYSNKLYNVNGRICPYMTILFGLAGIFIIKFSNPIIKKILSHLSEKKILILGSIFTFIFLIDVIISSVNFLQIKDKLKRDRPDNTREIKTQLIKRIKKIKINVF